MEKTNARTRRNTIQVDGETKTVTGDVHGGGPHARHGVTADTGTNGNQGTTLRGDENPRLGDDAKARLAAAANVGGDKRKPQVLEDTFLDERNDVMSVINELEDQLDRHQEIRETLERELTTTTEKYQTASQRVQELEWQVVTLQTRVDALEQVKQEITVLEEELGDANTRAQRSAEQLSTTEKDRTKLKNDLKTANKQLEELWAIRKERDGLRGDCKSLTTKLEELERMHRDAVEERAQLGAKLQETQIALEESQAERHQLQITLRTAEDRVRELSRVQESLTDKIEGLRTEKKSLQAQIVHLERENARLIEQRQFFECELTSLRNMNRSSETALASVKKAFAEVRVALSETKSRARRRVIDNWPRLGTTLRGLDGEELTLPEQETDTVAGDTAMAEISGTIGSHTYEPTPAVNVDISATSIDDQE